MAVGLIIIINVKKWPLLMTVEPFILYEKNTMRKKYSKANMNIYHYLIDNNNSPGMGTKSLCKSCIKKLL